VWFVAERFGVRVARATALGAGSAGSRGDINLVSNPGKVYQGAMNPIADLRSSNRSLADERSDLCTLCALQFEPRTSKSKRERKSHSKSGKDQDR